MPKAKTKRNYRKEYDDYYGRKGRPKTWSAGQRSNRRDKTSRNKAREMMIDRHGKSKLRGKDVDHRNHNAQDNSLGNLKIRSIHANRGDNGHTSSKKKINKKS